MKKIYIKYDPYEMITEFKVDNKSYTEMKFRDPWLDKVFRANAKIPLQSWIDPVPCEKWEGLLSFLMEMKKAETFSISFCGRKTDFEDLKESLESQNKKMGNVAQIKYSESEQQFIRTDSEIKEAIDEVVSIMSEDKFAAMVAKSENKELKDKYALMEKNVFDIEDKDFRVVFTGVYSSGKSTVINALVGKNILPQAEGTCTDKICYIKHDRDVVYSKVVYTKEDGDKKEFLCEDGEHTQNLIRRASGVNDLDKVEVYVDMSHLYPKNLEDQFKLVFVDTPGTESEEGDDISKRNEDETHIELTKRILSSDDKEMVVLVSDKKTESSGITKILDIFENKAGEDRGCYNDRFLFVLNKCDDYDYRTDLNENLESVVQKLKETVSKKSHGRERRNIANPRIFPISAGAALAIKIGCNDARNRPKRETELRAYYNAYNKFCDKLTDYGAEHYVGGVSIDEDNVSGNYLLDCFCDLSEFQKAELKKRYDYPDRINDYLLLHSGILSLETAIRSYIEKYAFPIKMRKLLRSFKSILEEVNEENRSYLEELENARAKLDGTKQKIDKEKELKDRDSNKQKELEVAKTEMKKIKKKVEAINTFLPEMDDIRSRYFGKAHEELDSFFEWKLDENGKNHLVQNITNKKAKEIKEKIISKIKELADQAKDLVEQVKIKRWKTAEEYAEEFNQYLDMLKKKGLLNAGSFNIESTVVYADIIGNADFMEYNSYARNIENPDKEHIETEYGILEFFASVGRSIATLFEPSQINRVDQWKYHDNLFKSLDANVMKLIKNVQSSYESDIHRMKKGMSNKMEAVLKLITEYGKKVEKRNQEIESDIRTEESYVRKKDALEKDCAFLTRLRDKLDVLDRLGR